jgi:uncharacterized protein
VSARASDRGPLAERGPVEDVYLAPVFDLWLLHAPLRRLSALVDQRTAARLARGRLDGDSGSWGELSRALAGDPPPAPGPTGSEPAPQFLGLVTTRSCNFACAYCAFGTDGARSRRMPASTAVAAIDWMARSAGRRGVDRLEVHLFGGEPTVAWEVLEAAVQGTRSAAARHGLMPYLEIATNGAVDPDRADFLGECFDTVVLSFDGLPELHDRYRPWRGGRPSSATVTRAARRLAESPAEVWLRCCVTEESVDRLDEITSRLCSELGARALTFETLQPTPQAAAAGLRPPDPLRFAAALWRARRRAEELGARLVYGPSLTGEPRRSSCPVGNDTLIVLPDGRVCACYLPAAEWRSRGLDLELGRLDEGGELELDREALRRLRRLVLHRPRCRACFCRWSCAGGCQVSHSPPGCPAAYDDFCHQTRAITACSLLDELGRPELADALAADGPALDRLARQPSDRPEELRRALA